MTDRDALLRTIIENPDDDAPRLVFADWLDEHGDPDRAEFIRVQCELDQTVLDHGVVNDRHALLSARSRDLLATNKDKWLGELGPLPSNRLTFVAFRRGMVGFAACTVKYLLAHAKQLLAAAPIEVFELRGRLTVAHVRALARCEWGAGVRGIAVEFHTDASEAIEALLAAWPFPEAQILDLSASGIDKTSTAWHDRWSGVAVAIARCASMSRLRRLSLAGCGVGDVGGRALADSAHLNGLAVLDLKHNPMSTEVRQQLRQRFGRRVLFDYRDHKGLRPRDLH